MTLEDDARGEALVAARLAALQLAPGCSVLEAAAGMGEHQLLGELLQPYQEAAMSQPDLRKDVHAAALRATTNSHAQCLRLLLDWDPSSTPELLEARDPEGRTPLIICAAQGNVDCMRLLLAHSPGTQVAAVTPTGESALMAACKNQHPAAVELLLQYRPLTQVTAVAADGFNALMAVVRKGSAASADGGAGGADVIVQLLLRHNPAAQVAAVNSLGGTALMVAACNGHPYCLPLLLAHSPLVQLAATLAGRTPLMYAANHGNKAIATASVRHLLAHSPGTQVAAADPQGFTALMLAAFKGHKPCLQLLLEHSPEVQLAAVAGGLESAVSQAAWGGHVDCLQLLLNLGPVSQQQLDRALLGAGRELLGQLQQPAPADEQLKQRWRTCIQRLLAAGAWTPAHTEEGVVSVVRSVNKELVARALVPDMANEAVVGLVLAVRHQQHHADPAREDTAGPSNSA